MKPYWIKRILPAYIDPEYYDHIVFHRGYTKDTLKGRIKEVGAQRGIDTDLKIDKNVFAIYFELSKN